MTTKPAPPFKRPTGMSFVVQTATNNTSSSFDDTRPPNGSGVPFEVFDAGEHNGGGMSLNFVVIMGILVGAAILSLFMPLLIRHFRGCRCIEPEEQEEAAAPTTVPITKKQRKDRRYTEIESWLISREVVAHDEHCEKAITYLDSVAVNPKDEVKKRSDTAATDEEWGSESTDDEKECPVCMEVIAVGDIISWSPNTQCDHTFHHRCIKEWLIKKTCCPFCRETFLPVDKTEGLPQAKQIQELLLGQQQRAASRYFCIRHGAVTLPSRPDLCFRKKCDLDHVLSNICRVPSRGELAEIRGHDAATEQPVDDCELGECVPVDTESTSDSEEEEHFDTLSVQDGTTDEPIDETTAADDEVDEPATL